MQVQSPPGAPESIKIGNVLLKLRFFCGEEEDSRRAYGYFDVNLGDMGVSRRRHPWLIAETIIHEVAHGIWFFFKANWKEARNEESVCSMMGAGLAMVIIDNPELYRWIGELCHNKELLSNWQPEEVLREEHEKTGLPEGDSV